MEYLLAFCLSVVFGLLSVFVNLVRKRSQINKQFPGLKMRPFDVMGDLKYIGITSYKNYPESSKLFQLLGAYYKLFKDSKFFAYWYSYHLIIVITNAEALEEVFTAKALNNKAWFYSIVRPWLGDGLLLSGNSKWKQRRKLMTPAFHFEILKDFLPVINEKCQILVQILRKETSQPWTDIQKMFILCSLDIICETTLGIHIGAQENSESEYVQAVHRVSKILLNRTISPLQWFDFTFKLTEAGQKFQKNVELLHNFTRKLITERKKQLLKNDNVDKNRKRKPLMDLLLDHHIHDNSLTEEDIREEVDTFTFEGHDTAAAGLSWTIYLIGLYEDVQKKIHEELNMIFGDDRERPVTFEDLRDLKYLECVIKESQRLYPSVPIIGRKFEEDVTLCGYKIPRGSSCYIPLYYLHRNENVFPDAEIFDPDRFLPENSTNRHPYAVIPFSAGLRNCIGQRFALMELKTVIANVLRNYTVESLEPRDKLIMVPDVILKTLHPLKVKFSHK